MALSQIQCLDDDNINVRINESKAEFLYSEEQRIALEILFQDGPEAYEAYLKAQDVRGFLSDCELEYLTRTVMVYNPGGTNQPQINGVKEDSKVPSEYWPERSDHSLSDLDMGWPDITSYRGVTRATVFTQPPMDGQPHIKEIVRKTITQAQKVIGVVMDLFTDVDIFRDLLDMSYKRRVAVYIVLEATGVPHFLRMCERAGMHKGHLKNLRVNCTRGSEFCARSSKKVCGTLGQKFMFVDGDKSVSGSYSFTWTASRLDRNVITLLTGQAVETFDKLFRELYFISSAVNLSSLKLDEEPEPESFQHAVSQSAVSAAMARKLYSAKYALLSNASLKSSGTFSGRNSSGILNPLPRFFRQPRMLFEEPRIHPGLVDMQRVNLMNYLPTWPEPDPPSDVIGIINIRDPNKPFQAHLMRSELFETSQAIRFKEPFCVPDEALPEKATPRPRLEMTGFLSSVMTDQQPVQPLKTKGEEAPNADLIKQAPLSSQHDQERVLTPPIPNPRMVHLRVINECDSHTAWVKGKKTPKVNSEVFPSKSSSFTATNTESTKYTNLCEGAKTSVFSQGPKDPCSAPDCAFKSESACSTASTKPSRGTEGPVSDAEKVRTMDTGIDKTNTKSSDNGSEAQLVKHSPTSDEYFQCNGNVPDEFKSPIHTNGLHTHSEIPNGKDVTTDKYHPIMESLLCNRQKIDTKDIHNTTKKSTILSMTNGESCQPDNPWVLREGGDSVDKKRVVKPSEKEIIKEPSQMDKSKPHKFQNNILNHQNGIKDSALSHPPISEHIEGSTQKTELQNSNTQLGDLNKTGANFTPQKKIIQKQDMLERHASHLIEERKGTASVVSQTKHDGTSLRAKEKASQHTLVGRDSKSQLLQQDLGSQYKKAGMQLSSSSKETLTKEGKTSCQNKHCISDEALFISEENDDQKEINLAVQNKHCGLLRGSEQVAIQGMKDTFSDSFLKSKRDQPTKVEVKHTGLSNVKAEPVMHPTMKSEAEKQVIKKGSPQLSHGSSTSNITAKVKCETGGLLKDKMEKSHHRSTQDVFKQLKVESKAGVRPFASKKEGCQASAHRDKPTQEVDSDLQERNSQEQARTKTESDGKKVFRTPSSPLSRTQPASRTEGSAKGPGIKSNSSASTASTTSTASTSKISTPTKSSSKYFQGRVFSTTKTKQVSSLLPKQSTTNSISPSGSVHSLNGPSLAHQTAGQTNSPLGQSLPAFDKSTSISTSKSSLSLPKLSPLRSWKERITRTPSQKKLTLGKKDAV